MEIKSTLANRSGQILEVIYNDIENEKDLDHKKIACVHAYCFFKDKLVVVYDASKDYWTPAGGAVEEGESVNEAVGREVREESNMRVLKQKLIGYQNIYEPQGVMSQTRSVCIVEPYGPFLSDPDGDISKIELIDPKDYKQYFDWGIIGDHIMQRALQIKAQLDTASITNGESRRISDLSVDSYRDLLSQESVNIVSTTRPIPTWIDQIGIEINRTNMPPLQVWLLNEPINSLERKLNEVLLKSSFSETVSSILIKDVMDLTRFFIDLTGNTLPFLSLRIIDDCYFTDQIKSVSKDWHVDTSVLTLTCVYAGRGMQWLEDVSVLRRYFTHDKMPLRVPITDEEFEIHEMNLFDVSILKGEIRTNEDARSHEFLSHFLKPEEKKSFNVNRGLVHKGPGYVSGDSRRLLLTISTMRVPTWLS